MNDTYTLADAIDEYRAERVVRENREYIEVMEEYDGS